MNLSNKHAEIFVPDGTPINEALARTTDLCIGAHQDDLEIMAYAAIAECYGQTDKHFTGVVVTDGSGSPRSGRYADYTNPQMAARRIIEQKLAAQIGEYSAIALMSYDSSEVKKTDNPVLINEIKQIILACEPNIIYTHNLADKHDAHVAVVINVIKAIREIPKDKRPKKLISLEVWRSLDWLSDETKYVQDTAKHENLAAALLGVFDSQVSGGKRYDLAAMGRRTANATFFASHAVDEVNSASFGLDITDIIEKDIDPVEFILGHIKQFEQEVVNRMKMFL